MENKTTTFEKKIKDTFIQYGRIPFLVVAGMVLVLFIIFYGYTRIYRVYSVKQTINREISTSLTKIRKNGLSTTNSVYQNLYKLRSDISDGLQVIIYDKNFDVQAISQPSLEGSDYLKIFNRVILSNQEINEWNTTVYRPIDSDQSYLVYSYKNHQSYYMYFIPNIKSLQPLDMIQNDLVISDTFDNVFASTSQEFMSNTHKVNLEKDNGYKLVRKPIDHNLVVYFYLKNNFYSVIMMIVSLSLLITYGLMKKLNEKYAKRIGEDFSYSIKQLHEAVKEMESGNIETCVNITSNDEFKDLGIAFNRMNQRLNELITRNQRLLVLNKDAEIKQLEAQFNPHFLFNTLETIKYLVDDDPELASELIVKTTILLRYSINDNDKDIKFSDDLEYIKKYLEIHKTRLQERFTYTIDIDKEVLDLKLPKLLLQPLIENSLKHGFHNKMNLELNITAYLLDGDLYIYVIDDGGGMHPQKVEELNNYDHINDHNQGYGIKSVIQRIKLTYEENAQFKIYSDQQNTIVEIVIKGGLNVI
ncbi:sensor histidine kinase [Erysipelothrix urinaevulpis]|uniref:sensor histidine kinase n=1 Tax=Erysipelothrix urinaevulpis TaxID=2683717 RepID=UPI0013597836|nr:histidine kinase [Erysipelothrix urinaevulpis]